MNVAEIFDRKTSRISNQYLRVYSGAFGISSFEPPATPFDPKPIIPSFARNLCVVTEREGRLPTNQHLLSKRQLDCSHTYFAHNSILFPHFLLSKHVPIVSQAPEVKSPHSSPAEVSYVQHIGRTKPRRRYQQPEGSQSESHF
ncbi:hypothetical protein M413DRAFT_179104 [Hebeloma cylindrosporum]|uniref:Uncharacterized protein n=1 Tax=Hebeloma cylindrosporum TaxID=76867 RepID=A0A0C3C9Y8_HEBCY|nr:hypothetical protein M413DRAFT_179104 [Hebeloma cylindrosporum h7]